MKIYFSTGYILTFLLLLVVMLECHEIVHITVGYFICGCWGTRDFNVWSLCPGCSNADSFGWIATLAGPLFSFVMMWVGKAMLNSFDPFKKSFGLALIFANIPFGRLTTVMMGGGDEMVIMRHFFPSALSRSTMMIITSSILFLLIFFPVKKAFQSLTNRYRLIWIAGLLTLPLLFLLLYTLIFLNTLLKDDVLDQVWVMGTPAFITIHTMVAMVLLLIFYRKLNLDADIPENQIR